MSAHTSRLTVVHIVSGDLWAGAEVAVFNLLNQLRQRPELTIMAIALNEGTLSRRLEAIGIETFVVPEGRMSATGLAVSAHRLLKHRPIDIIHSHRYKENLLASVLAGLRGARSLVSTAHGLADPPLPDTSVAARIRMKTRLDYFFLRYWFDRVVAVSAEMKSVLVRAHGFPDSQVRVIHNGIPLPRAGEGAVGRSGRLHVGSVGRLDPIKRFDLLVDVAAQVRSQTDRVRFSILGDGPEGAALQKRIEALGLSDCVELLPARQDPHPYYRSLDVYLNTSLHEGLPLSILEAMGAGTPVVAPSVGGIPEIVSHGIDGLLVDSSEPREFARSCIRLLGNDALRAGMGERARQSVAVRFRDTLMAEKYHNLYLELCVRTAARPARRRLAAAS